MPTSGQNRVELWHTSNLRPCGEPASQPDTSPRRAFLRKNNVHLDAIDQLDDDRIEKEMERDLREQIAHNIDKGVLKPTPEGDVKYSWRGMIYLWCQFLLDLVRL